MMLRPVHTFRLARDPPEGVLPSCQTQATIRSDSRRQAPLGSRMFSAPDALHTDHHRAHLAGCPRWRSRVSDPHAMAVGRLALGGGLDLRRLVGILRCRHSLVASLE